MDCLNEWALDTSRSSYFQGMQIYMQSERGEIEVYLCPDDDSASPYFNSPIKRHLQADDDADTTDDAESVSSPIKIKREQLTSSEMSPLMMSRLSHRLDSMDDDGSNKFALISSTPDFGPMGSSRIQLETLDQDPCGKQRFYLNYMKKVRTQYRVVPKSHRNAFADK